LCGAQIADAVNREGAKLLDHWFIGSKASYVICEGSSIQKYIAHSNNIVTVSNVTQFGQLCASTLCNQYEKN
jgi:hypothetical protein